MKKNIIFIFCFFLLCSCNLFSPEEKLKDLVGEKYRVGQKIGGDGDTIIFEVNDPQGQKFAAKLWLQEKELKHLRATTPFDNDVLIHTVLKDVPYVNRLHDVVGNQVTITEFLKGTELHDYLATEINKEAVIALANQLIDAFKAIESQNVIPLEASAKNVCVVDQNTPRVKLVNTGTYFAVDDVLKRNEPFDKNDFNFFNVDSLKKHLKDIKKLETGDYYVVDNQKYQIIPPVTLYSILCNRMEIFSRLLTKLAYIEAGRGTEMPHVNVTEATEDFGDRKLFLARPWTEEIEERARNILHMASLKDTPHHYTAENFREDVGETFAISNMIYERTQICLEHVENCSKS